MGESETRTNDEAESDLTPACLSETRVSLAKDFFRNQSMTFLAALELAVLFPGGLACLAVKASTVTIEGDD